MEPGSFITAFTEECLLPPSKDTWIWSTLFHSVCPRSILLFLSHLRLGLPSGSFRRIFPLWLMMRFSFSPHLPPVPCMLSSLNWSPWWLLVRSTNHETPRYAFFSMVLSLHLFCPNMFLSTLFTDIVIRYPSLNVRGQVCFPSESNNGQGLVFVFILRSCK